MNHLKYLIYCNLFRLYDLLPCRCVLNFRQNPILDSSITCHFTACDIMLQLTSWEVGDWLNRYNLIKLWMFACKQSSKINNSVQMWSWWALLLRFNINPLPDYRGHVSRCRSTVKRVRKNYRVCKQSQVFTVARTEIGGGNTVGKLGAVSQCCSLSTNTKLWSWEPCNCVMLFTSVYSNASSSSPFMHCPWGGIK